MTPLARVPTTVVLVVAAVMHPACSDRMARIPRRIEQIGLDIPASASDFYMHHSGGIPFSLFQYRFDFAPRDLKTFEAQLPCPLGAVQTGPPEFASVGTNDRTWYTPERATSHRGCEGSRGIWHTDVLLDVSRADRYRIYIVFSD